MISRKNNMRALHLSLLGLLAAISPFAKAADYEISSGTTAYPAGLHLNAGDALVQTGGTLFVGGGSGIAGPGVYNISQGSLIVDGSDLTISSAIALRQSTAGAFELNTGALNATLSGNIAKDATGNFGSGGNGFWKTGAGMLTLSGDSRAFNTFSIYGGTVAQTAGLTTASEIALGHSAFNADVTFLMSGGTLGIVKTPAQAGSLRVGDFGASGTFNQTGGTVIINSVGALNVGNQGGTGVYNLGGGELILDEDLHNIGRSSGSWGPSRGTMNITGGSMTLRNGAEFIVGNYNKDDASQGIVNQTGGVVTVADGSRIYFQGKSTTTTSKYNLDGGLLQIAGNGLKALDGVLYEFNFGSGTMQAAGNGMSSEANINLTAATAVFDTNGLESTLTGAVSGAAKLVLRGDGALQLTNANNNIAGGIDLAQSALRIASAASLGTTLSSVNFIGTPATTTGTLIAAANSSVLFDSAGAAGNRIVVATGNTGALHAEAGSTLTLANNNIDAPSASGAALHVSDGARFEVTAAEGGKVRFTGNNAYDSSDDYGAYGGAIYNAGTLTLTGVEMDNNTVDAFGAAIHNAGRLDIANSHIHHNSTYDGGVMTARTGLVTIASSTLSDNVTTWAGGALYVYAGGTVALDNVLFSSNTAASAGGGAIITEDTPLAGTRVTGSHVRFENNRAENIGGAIRNNGGQVDLVQFEFIGNRSDTQGGAIHNGYVTTLENGAFSGNVSTAEGGAIYNLEAKADLTLTDVLFSSNTATNKGGAIYNYGGKLTLDRGVFTGNAALGGSGAGGAIHNENASLPVRVTNAYFEGNTANYGAAISNKAGAITVTSATFSQNISGAAGGAIYNYGSGTITLVDVLFDRNAASDVLAAGGGGAIHNEATYPNVITGTNVRFEGNTASSAGALRNNNAHVALTGATFSNNRATTGGGGAIYTAGTLSLTDASFLGNSAYFPVNGGAIYLESGILELNVTAGNTSTFEGNTSAGVANSIHLASTGTLAVNTAAGATLDMRDPMSGNAATGQTLTINKTGAGLWTLGGTNVFRQAGTGKTVVTVESGMFAIGADSVLQLDGADSVLDLRSGATLGVAASANPGLVTTNFTNAAGSTIDVAGYDGSNGTFTLITASNAIARNYAITIGGVALSSSVTEDVFVAMTEDTGNANQVRITAGGLVWNNTAIDSAHGTFFIDSDIFTLSAALADNTTPTARIEGWDGGSLKKTGAGTLVLAAVNTYTGTTTVSAGTLENTGVIAGALVDVASGALINSGTITSGSVTNSSYLSNAGNIANNVTNTGTFINAAGGYVRGLIQSSGTTLNTGTLDQAVITVGQLSNEGVLGTARLGMTAGLSNSGSISTLSNDTLYSGKVTNLDGGKIATANISYGTLDNNAGAAIDTLVQTTLATVNNAGLISRADVSGGVIVNNGGTISTSLAIGTGTLVFNSGTISTAITNNGALNYANTDAYTQANAISGGGTIAKTGAGDLTIAADVSNGALNLGAGKLTVADTGTLTLTGALNIGASSTLAVIAGTGTSVIADSVSFDATGKLDITGYTTATSSTYPFIPDVARTVIHTTGNNITGFNAANVTVSGTTAVDYLKVSAHATAADIIIDTMLSWNLTDGAAHGNFTIADGQTFTITTALADNTAAHPGWDGASLTKLGEGTLILAGVNTYTGTTAINGGTLENTGVIAGSLVNVVAGSLLNSGTINTVVTNAARTTNSGFIADIATTGSLINTGTITTLTQTAGLVGNHGGLITTATINGGGLANNADITTLTQTTGTLANNTGATIDVLNQTGGSATNAGLITSATTSGGTLLNTGTIATAATINGGTLANTGGVITAATTIGANGTLLFDSGSLAAPITNNGALTFANATAYTLDRVVSGAGALNKTGAGDLTIAVVQTYTGATNVKAGTLNLGAANILATSALVDLAANTTLNLGGHNQGLKALAMANGSLVDFNSAGANYATLAIGKISGSGSFAMRANPADGADAHDTITIADAGSTGDYHINVTLGSAIDNSMQLVETTAGGVTITGGANYGLESYEFEQTASGWKLGNAGTSDTGDVVLSTAAVLGTDWLHGLDSVHLRMGELRTVPAARGDVWVRTNAYRLNGAPGAPGDTFRQTTWGVTAGGDAAIVIAPDSTILVGGFIQMGRSDRTYDNFGKSDTDTVAVGVYGTAILKDGWFIDATLKYDHYKNELDARAANAARTKADYNSNAFGLSVEAGRRIMLSTDKRYWLEPSVQLATVWIDSADYTTNDGMRVNVNSSNAWQYRAQVRAGANYGQWIPYVKFAGAGLSTSGGKVRTNAGDRTYAADFDGARFEAGAGVGYVINPGSQLYLDYEYNKSSNIERPWAINLGYRRVW